MSEAATLVALLAARADGDANRTAVDDGDRCLTYRQLDLAANAVAAEIVRTPRPAGEPVGVLLEPSVDAVASIYGVLKSGTIAVPLDRSAPRQAVLDVLRHAGARAVVSDAEGGWLAGEGFEPIDLPSLPPEAPPPDVLVAAADPAAIYYTSGSTGDAKGFVITHGAQLEGARSSCAAYGLGADDRVALLFNHSFGASRVGLFGALVAGAALRVYDAHRLGPAALATALADDAITFAHCSPSLLRRILEELPDGPNLPALRTLVTGAEALERTDVIRIRQRVSPGCRLAYSYAVSEAGPVTAMLLDADAELPEGLLPVGVALPGIRVTIDRPGGQAIGEIVVAGPGLAREYWHDPARTAERFVRDDAGTPMFRTGDRGRLREDGLLECHGRLDNTVKVRGFSVDLTLVQRAVLATAQVDEAVVVLDAGRRHRLVAYVVANDRWGGAAKLRTALAGQLSGYMVPSAFVVLDALPRTSRGKVDVAALPPVPTTRPDLATPFVAPRFPLERDITEVFSEVLELRPVGVDDDFFTDLGGDSLAAAEAMTLIEARISWELGEGAFLEARTAGDMARLIMRGATQRWTTPVVPYREEGSLPPFFCVHGGGGGVLSFAPLAQRLSPDRPFYALQRRAIPHQAMSTMPRLAAFYIEQVRSVQPTGPLLLGGYCSGGALAYEMATQLAAAGEQPALLVMIDTPSPHHVRTRPNADGGPLHRLLPRWAVSRLKTFMLDFRWYKWTVRSVGLVLVARVTGRTTGRKGASAWDPRAVNWMKRLMRRFHPKPFAGDVLMLWGEWRTAPDPGWAALMRGRVDQHVVPGGHVSLLGPPHVDVLASRIEAALERAGAGIDVASVAR